MQPRKFGYRTVVLRKSKKTLGEFQRSLWIALGFIFLYNASGQTTNGLGGAFLPTNNVREDTNFSAPPGLTNQVPNEAETSLTNQFGFGAFPAQQSPAFPGQPTAVGPATLGAPPPANNINGTSALVAGPLFAVPTTPGIPLWGPIDIHPRAFYSFTYGNGIDSSPGQQGKTVVNVFTPGFLLDLGKNWTLSYGPTFDFYSNPAFKNTVDESAILTGKWATENWNFGLTQSYNQSTEPLVETGAQTAQASYFTALSAAYQMGGNLSLQLGANQNFRSAAETGLADLKEWTTSDWLNYQPIRQIAAGIGVTLGYDKIDPGSDMPFEQIQGRLDFTPGSRFKVSLTGGVEDRQFTGPSAPALFSPIFSANMSYQVFKGSVISAAASRSVNPSFYQNQVLTSTALSLGLSQEITRKISLSLNYGYSTEPLQSIVPAPLPQYFFGNPTTTALEEIRNDTTTSYRLSLNYALVTRGSASIFYSISKNGTDQANFSYTSHQIGFSLTYQY
jgi:hypothetical protein